MKLVQIIGVVSCLELRVFLVGEVTSVEKDCLSGLEQQPSAHSCFRFRSTFFLVRIRHMPEAAEEGDPMRVIRPSDCRGDGGRGWTAYPEKLTGPLKEGSRSGNKS
jgi:hypothetical protein